MKKGDRSPFTEKRGSAIRPVWGKMLSDTINPRRWTDCWAHQRKQKKEQNEPIPSHWMDGWVPGIHDCPLYSADSRDGHRTEDLR